MEKVRFYRPNPLFHKYVSDSGDYVVEQCEKPGGGIDDFAWAAYYKNQPLAERPYLTRRDAFWACHQHHDPQPVYLTKREFKLLQHLVEGSGEASYVSVVNDGAAGLSPAAAISIIGYLRRRELIREEGKTISITAKGRAAVVAYKPPESDNLRKSIYLRYGATELPKEWPRATMVQWWQATVDELTARLRKRGYVRGSPPFSANAVRQYEVVERLLKEAKDKLHAALIEQNRCIEQGKPVPWLDPHARD